MTGRASDVHGSDLRSSIGKGGEEKYALRTRPGPSGFPSSLFGRKMSLSGDCLVYNSDP